MKPFRIFRLLPIPLFALSGWALRFVDIDLTNVQIGGRVTLTWADAVGNVTIVLHCLNYPYTRGVIFSKSRH